MAKFISILSLAVAANAHAIFHSATVNGKSQGLLFGVRAPSSNNPIQDVSSSAMACNSGLNQPVSKDVIELNPGDKFGMQWNHVIGGPQGSGDADDPIAASHKGPVMVYMAKVDDAASADGAGLKWFKTAEEGLNPSTGQWGVDTLIANKGAWDFTIPNLEAGDYLLRGEVLALHSAGSTGEAQFYVSCAAVRVGGSGTCAPSDTVSFPGAYKANDAGILISIYGGDGKPNNGGKAYTAPGPKIVSCASGSGSGGSKTTTAVVKTTSAAAETTAAQTSGKTSAEQTSAKTTAQASSVTTTAQSSDVKTTAQASSVQTTRSFSMGQWATTKNNAASTKGTSKAAPTTFKTSTLSASSVKPSAATSKDAPTSSGGSSPQPSYTGLPGGKKYVCYEVFD